MGFFVAPSDTKQMNLKPGDEFIITLGKKHIRLRQIDSDEREE
ncbi:hypothetical protein CBF18_09365, partial [Mastigocladus laminosus WC112]